MSKLDSLFEEFIELQQFSSGRKLATIKGYRAAYELFRKLVPTIDEPSALTSKAVSGFFRELQIRKRIVGKGQIKSGVKSSTVLTYRSKLDVFFNWLKVKNIIKDSPFDGVDRPNVSYTDRKFIAREDIEKILVAITFNIPWVNNLVKKRNISIFSILLNCGIRKGELLGLKITDLNFKNHELLVRGETSKSGKDRVIPLNSAVTNAIDDYLEERKRYSRTTPFLFVSEHGDRPLSEQGLKHLVAKVSKLSGVKFHVHRFRHTFATNLLAQGSDVYKIKELLGHNDIRMTAVYLRCMPPRAMLGDVETIARIDKLI